MKLIARDDLPIEIARLGMWDAWRIPKVVRWVEQADDTSEVQALRTMVDATINTYRRHRGEEHLSTSIFSLLAMDFERHAKNKTEANKLAALRRKAAKVLGVPINESSLVWMLAASLPELPNESPVSQR